MWLNNAKVHTSVFQKIVDDWNNMEGEALDVNCNPVKKKNTNLAAYGQRFGVKYGTLYKYFRYDISKRIMLGNGICAKPLMTPDKVGFMGVISECANRGN